MPTHLETDRPPAADRAASAPVLATMAARAIELLERRQPGDADGAPQIFEIDAVLTGAVLRLARSPLYGGAATRLPLQECMDRIGTQALCGIVQNLPRASTGHARDAIAARCGAWSTALAVAAAARWLSNQGDYDDPSEAYLCGLMFAVTDGPQGRRAPELAARWRVGDRIRGVLAHRAGNPEAGADPRLASVVALAADLTKALGFGDPAGADAAHVADHAARAAVEEAISLEFAHAAAVLRLPPSPAREFASRLADEEARRLGNFAGGASHGPLSPLAFASFIESVSRLRHETSIPSLVQQTLDALHDHGGFDRLVLIERDPVAQDTARVREVRCRTRLAADATPHTAEVPADASSLFAAVTEAPAAVRASSVRSDPSLTGLLGVADAAVAAVRAGGTADRVLAGDFGVSGRAVEDADVERLGAAATMIGLLLEAAALTVEGRTLRALAEKDELTGINNRRRVLDILRREVDRARRYGKPLSVALVDVDHFKSWNDLHGHGVGDVMLQSVAQLVSSVSRDIDSFGRYGGEEFLIVLPETTADHAMIYAERVRTTVEGYGVEQSALYAPSMLTVSIGVSQLLPRGDDFAQLIQRADQALYAAKKHGRNRVCVEMTTPVERPAPPVAKGVLDEI